MECSLKVPENELVRADMLKASYDSYHRVIANIKDDMDENVFAARLQASIPNGGNRALVKPLKICSLITPPSYASLMWKYVPWSITCDKPMLGKLASSIVDGVFSIVHDSCNRAFSVSNINSLVEMTNMATKLLKGLFLKALQ
nr:NUDIX hydrolase 6-like protein [Tanacetum cinerariifolium]